MALPFFSDSSDHNVQALLARGFVAACRAADVPAMMPRRVEVNGKGFLVCRYRMRFWVVDEVCPHRQKSMALGLVMGAEVVCPHHQYRFDLTTGQCVSHPCAPVSTYEAVVEGDTVYVRLAEPLPTVEESAP